MNDYLLCMILGAALCAALFALLLRKKAALAAGTLVLGGLLGLILARLFYVAMFPAGVAYEGLPALFHTSIREFSFFGGCAGAVLGAALAGRIGGIKASKFLDLFSPIGALMVCIARAAEYYLGMLGVGGDVYAPFFCRFPFAVVNEWEEWYAALFMAEALLALIAAIVFFFRKKESALEGLRFQRVVFYLCLPQILCESLRSECLRWGFVRCEQLLCAVCVVVLILLGCLKAKERRFAKRFWPVFVSLLCIAALVGIEFALDRLDLPSLFWYALMALVLFGMALLETYNTSRRLKDAKNSASR